MAEVTFKAVERKTPPTPDQYLYQWPPYARQTPTWTIRMFGPGYRRDGEIVGYLWRIPFGPDGHALDWDEDEEVTGFEYEFRPAPAWGVVGTWFTEWEPTNFRDDVVAVLAQYIVENAELGY